MKGESPRGLLNQELKTVEWSQHDMLTVLRAAEHGGHQSMKATTKLILTMMIALVLMATTALAATLLFSPRYDALQLADQALLEKYGITEEMQPGLIHSITEADGKTVVTYEVVESAVMQENRFGMYTVTVAEGKAEAVWSMDGMDTTGGLDAPAWGAEQLLMYVQEYAAVMSHMETNGMLRNVSFDAALFHQQAKQREQDRQTALSMAQITLEDAADIGQDAVIVRYRLTEQQAAMLVRFDGSDPDGYSDESTYEIVEGRPLVNLFFHLTQKPGEWAEKDGIYVVTINLTDGAVEDIFYDTGLMGNG